MAANQLCEPGHTANSGPTGVYAKTTPEYSTTAHDGKIGHRACRGRRKNVRMFRNGYGDGLHDEF